MDYFELLEQNTDDAEIQLQLYKACLDGAGRGNEEAEEWLQAAAANGNEEAAAIINERTAVKDNGSESRYAKLSMLELLDYADSDYYAAKELINRDLDCSWQEAIRLRKNICAFDESTVEDWEVLVYQELLYLANINDISGYCLNNAEAGYLQVQNYAKSNYQIYMELKAISVNEAEWFLQDSELERSFVNDCKNSIELGSEKAKRYLLFLGLGQIESPESYVKSNFSLYELSEEIAKSGNYSDKFCHYCMLFSDEFSNAPNIRLRRAAWKEELENAADAENYPLLNSNPKLDDLMKIINDAKETTLETAMGFLAIITLYKDFFTSGDIDVSLLSEKLKTLTPSLWSMCELPYALYTFFTLLKTEEIIESQKKQTEEQRIVEEQLRIAEEQRKQEFESWLKKVKRKLYFEFILIIIFGLPAFMLAADFAIICEDKKSRGEKAKQLLFLILSIIQAVLTVNSIGLFIGVMADRKENFNLLKFLIALSAFAFIRWIVYIIRKSVSLKAFSNNWKKYDGAILACPYCGSNETRYVSDIKKFFYAVRGLSSKENWYCKECRKSFD